LYLDPLVVLVRAHERELAPRTPFIGVGVSLTLSLGVEQTNDLMIDDGTSRHFPIERGNEDEDKFKHDLPLSV
tara:strand:- start:8150 stop:8368 length:219 start_codon:yes stop_codon:yes gene_type:complete